jgi:hypothetical protein
MQLYVAVPFQHMISRPHCLPHQHTMLKLHKLFAEDIMADIITQNEHFTIWYYPEHGIVHNRFHKYACGESFRDCLSTGLGTLKQRNATK